MITKLGHSSRIHILMIYHSFESIELQSIFRSGRFAEYDWGAWENWSLYDSLVVKFDRKPLQTVPLQLFI